MMQLWGPSHHLMLSSRLLIIVIVLAVWETVWRLIAFWKAARNNQMAWFVVMAVINTAGILEILYIAFFQKDRNTAPRRHKAD